MEHVGEVMSEGEWSNFSHEIYSSSPDEEANFMEQLLGNSSLLSYLHVQESAKIDEASIYSSSSDDYNHFHSEESTTHGFNNGSFLFPPSPYASHQVTNAENGSISMDFYHVVDESKNSQNDMLMETNGDEFILINQDLSDDGCMESNEINHDADHHIMNGLHGADLHLGMAHDDMMLPMNNDQFHSSGDEKVRSPTSVITKKRPPVSPVDNFVKSKRSFKQKKSQIIPSSSDIYGGEDEEDDEKLSNTMSKRQNSMMTCCSTDEDDLVGTSRSSSKKGGKTRANRGSATDPQSLYARKRRERINERLKILQNLVPNGTKVDISTMLEEAVQYVNFLQLQIKLLSSDDLWIYSPIAYNGMDIGFDFKIDSTKS